MNKTPRIGIVEKLRGLAALSVAWHHLSRLDHGWVRASGDYGRLGVAVFFVISGFVIPLSVAKTNIPYHWRDFPKFLARRMIRLEPPYIASIFLFIGLRYLAYLTPGFQGPKPYYGMAQILSHFLYIIPLTNYSWIQFIYWTLAYEFVFYVFIGLSFPYIGGNARVPARLAIIGITALVAVKEIGPYWALFALGFSVFRCTTRRETQKWALAEVTLVSLAIGLNHQPEALAGFGTAIIILFNKNLPRTPRWMEKPLVGLGSISYSLYLIHVPIGSKVANILLRWLHGTLAEILVGFVSLVASVVAAVIFWYLIERPAINAGRRFKATTPQFDKSGIT